ncbi:MAG: hypothetical protein R3348_02950, partial [Xanthomonadales bacterium]|nr:hypothetical protein [Xanthomonadales bacterium]
RVVQTDVAPANAELVHMRPTSANFSFDPVRGIMVNPSSAEILDGDWLFYIHSDTGSGGTRNFELQMFVNVTGKITLCADDDRKSLITAYPEC